MRSQRMVFKFPKELIDETISCFKEEDGLFLTEQQADEYLSSFAELYIAFARANSRPHPGGVGGRPATCRVSSDRGVSNTSGTL